MIGSKWPTRLPRLDLDGDLNAGGGAIIGGGLSAAADTQVGGNLELVGGGDIVGAGTIRILPTGGYITQIGDAGSPSQLSTPTNDDLFVCGRLEIDGAAYCDSTLRVGSVITANNDITMAGGLWFVGGTNTSRLNGSSSYTQTLFALGSALGHNLVIGEYAHRGKNYDHAAQTHPTLWMQSANDPDADNTEAGYLCHDGSNFKIRTLKGAVAIQCNASAPTLATNGSLAFSLDETGHNLVVTAKYNDGTNKTASIALT